MKKKAFLVFLLSIFALGMGGATASAEETDTFPEGLSDNQYTYYEDYVEPNGGERSDMGETAGPAVQARSGSVIDNIQAGESNRPSADFIDVSSHNGTISVANYAKMMSYGIRGVVVKATEGTTYMNPYAQSQVDNALAAGMKVSVYHYAHYTTSEIATNEANYFADKVTGLNLLKSVNMIIDIEEPKQFIDSLNDNTAAFKNALNAKGYPNVYYYMSKSRLNTAGGTFDVGRFGATNIWVAQYPYTPTADMNWNSENAAWQWSSRYYVEGISHPFDINTDYTGAFTSGAAASSDVVIYRAYNRNNGGHLYTENYYEYQNVINHGWQAEGIAWYAPNEGVSVKRLYNPNSGEHFYTPDTNEYENVAKAGWRKEGHAFYSDPNKGLPIYRLFNPNAKGPGSHHYTKNTNEVQDLVRRGWREEDGGLYGLNK